MNNGRFSISMHILTLLEKSPNEVLSSDYLAGSININPVLVRKEIINLRKHGLVSSKEGKSGGSYLARPAKEILLSDVYEAVRQNSILGQNKNKPNPKCIVGKQIDEHLNNLSNEVEYAMIKKLSKTTLADFSKKFN